MQRPRYFTFVSYLLLLLVCHGGYAQPTELADTESAKSALSKLGGLIGEWRGVGQERRGSTRGAWREQGEFVWDFSNEKPAIQYNVTDGKHLTQGLITWNAADNSYELLLTIKDEAPELLTGTWDKTKLEFTSPPTPKGETRRITITPLNEKRTLVLHEKSSISGKSFLRLGEIGYTRAGTRLAVPGGGQRECIVTGGTATTPVMYKGETYYVCCSGCKQAFDDDPEGIINDYKARLAEKKAATQ